MKGKNTGKNRNITLKIIIPIVVICGCLIAYFSYKYDYKEVNTSANIYDSGNIHNNSSQTTGSTTSSIINTSINSSAIIPGDNIIESAKSYAMPANEVAQILAGHSELKTKEVFLTFDDGPSQNTSKILQILKENNVHATFFILGSQLKDNTELQQEVKNEIYDGNAIGNHTFSHNYKILYPNNVLNVSSVMNEINETNSLLQSILGSNFDTRILRLPGGYMSRKYYKDPNLPALNKALDDECITSLDWDAETGDATTNSQMSIQTLVNNVMSHIANYNQPVILMHDSSTKADTVEALPSLIKALKEKGYKFMVIENAPSSSFENLSYTTNTGSNQGQGTLT